MPLRRLALAVLALAALVALRTPPPLAASGPAPRQPRRCSCPRPASSSRAPEGGARGWSVESLEPAGAATVARDTQAPHGGGASLRIANARAASVAVVSEPVSLRVGQVYRLRARVRTEQAVSDPLARYPTAVAACLSMASFPFTNHSPAVGATRDWTTVETLFVATRAQDRVRLHLGLNGTATGTAWFDDVELQELADVAEFVPLETVRWADKGFRTEQGGWILLHVEGQPYARGYQHGYLMADEIAAYLAKLAQVASGKDPAAGWAALRTLADATMLRGFSEELLTEMRGIADGAAKGGATFEGRPVDFLDVVTLNSAIDVDYLKTGLATLPHALTGRSFLTAEEELKIPDGQHKCSALAATGPATADGKVVFGQIFMWAGYTGVHFNVLLDLVPAQGQRLVFQTFPGGIHSGTDFYMNGAGLIVGETTVAQTPWNKDGAPMSDRIRRAVQYGTSIDEVVAILAERNNGMYTNDWPMADVKTGEAAICLLGTAKKKVWRSGEPEAPFGTPGFLWANNNARDPEVRSEYASQPNGAPYDPVFAPWNRDLAFNAYYQREKGRIDVPSVARLFASSPINLAHACDGKITTSEMAGKLVFWAHQGKVTLREKFPAKGNRRMPDLPGARPHLTLGYTAVTPIWLADKLAEAKAAGRFAPFEKKVETPKLDVAKLKERFGVEGKQLWQGTLFPKSAADHWLSSGTAGYWQVLHDLPEDEARRPQALADALARQNVLLLATLAREADLPAREAERSYTRYAPYRVARVKGTFALHQLRLQLGTQPFLKLMRTLHERFAGREVATADFVAVAREVDGPRPDAAALALARAHRLPRTAAAGDLRQGQGLARDGRGRPAGRQRLPAGHECRDRDGHLAPAVAAAAGRHPRPRQLRGGRERPVRVAFDPGGDIPTARARWAAWPHVTERWPETLIVHGSVRADEAQRTLALRFQTTLADAFTEQLVPVVKDSEVSEEQLATRDLVLLGGPRDNALVARLFAALGEQAPAALGDGHFRFRGRVYGRADEGLFLALPSPFGHGRLVYLYAGNSALQLHEMTKAYVPGLPAFALFEGEEAKQQGYLEEPAFVLAGPPSS